MAKNKQKHLIYIFLIVLSVVSAFTLHQVSYLRLINVFQTLGHSVKVYAIEVFYLPLQTPVEISKNFGIDIKQFLPFDIDEIARKLQALPSGLFNLTNFCGYFVQVLLWLHDILYYIVLLLPVYLLLKMLIERQYLKPNEKAIGKNSWQLRLYLKRIRPKKERFKCFIADLYCFGAERFEWRPILSYNRILIFIWLLNLNIATIAVELFAYYLFLVATFALSSLPFQLARLLIDLVIMLSLAPVIFWLVVGYFILDKFRRSVGYKFLRHHEMMNRGFINGLPLNNLIVGVMEAGKTTMAVDMALSYEQILRDKALELMLKNDFHFEKFPFRQLEIEIEKGVEEKIIINLATVRKFVSEKYQKFMEKPTIENCFGYDFEKYGYFYNNELIVQELFGMINEYAQLYLIYYLPSSLIVSNIAIRTDSRQIDNGHFPLWQDDFFKTPAEQDHNQMSHIIDFDCFRMGKKLGTNDQETCIEYGVGVMSEKGKERGNALENKQYKKEDNFTNPLNDLFNLDLKLRRHSATVGYFPFIKFFSDEQRPESVGADEREVSHILHMDGTKAEGITMPFFGVEELLNDYLQSKFTGFYVQYRNARSDNTLLMYLFKSVVTKFSKFNERVKNTFGYKKIQILTEHGTMDGEPDKHDYFISFKKIYSDRFSTDCYKDIYEQKAVKAKKGLQDLETYQTSCATLDELKKQNSYFIRDITKNNTTDDKKIYRKK